MLECCFLKKSRGEVKMVQMKIISYNIRGLGGGLRKTKLRNWLGLIDQICYAYKKQRWKK